MIQKRWKNKKGAIELSIGTIVIVVLAMSMLILGLMLVRSIFSGSTDAVESINKAVVDQINKIFTKSDNRLAIAPPSRIITLKQGSSTKGFAFSVRNKETTEQKFTFTIGLDPSFNIKTKCPGLTKKEADSWVSRPDGSFSLPPGAQLENTILVLFEIPETAPPCTLPYNIEVRKGTSAIYVYDSINIKIEGK